METKIQFPQQSKAAPADERNIEIKARIDCVEEFERRVEKARLLTGKHEELLEQRDVFFNSQNGRFKLRYLPPPAHSLLVHYDRPDIAGPKLSKFNKIEINQPELMEKILTQANGVMGVLSKERLLFIYENTRIHLDKVKDLGYFMELEVCLSPEESIEDGQIRADKLMKAFSIKEEDLITGSYFDKLQERRNSQ